MTHSKKYMIRKENRGGGKLVTVARSKNAFIHSAFARALGLTMLFAITMLAALPEVGRGQCPDPNAFPPYGVAWTEASAIETLSTGCQVSVTYCWRNVEDDASNYENQYVVIGVTPFDPPGGCPDLSGVDIVTQAIDKFWHDPIVMLWVNPCDGPGGWSQTTTVDLVEATCWKLCSGPDCSGMLYTVCLDGTAWCEETCQACADLQNAVNYINCTTQSFGTGNCTPISQTDVWNINECYDLDIWTSCYNIH